MMSCACGRRLNAWREWKKSYSPWWAQLLAISGVTEEVAQVSNTSVSPVKLLEPQGHFFLGLSLRGSMGSSDTAGRSRAWHFLQVHTGMGMPKWRWREI